MEKAQYAIMRFAKYKGPEIGNIEAHNERTKEKYASNPDVDTSRSKYNFHLVKPPGKYRAESERQIAATGCRTRKDSIRMIETLFTASPEFFKGKKRAEIRVFFEEALHFLEQHQSKETIISAVVHMDEKTPHMHLCFVPLTEDGRLSAKDIMGNKKKLTWWQDEFWKHMVKKFPDLERGESASLTGRDHIPPRVFKEMTRLTKQKSKLEDLLTGINPFNAKSRAEEICKILDSYIPSVEKMDTLLRKYGVAFTKTASENKKLKTKNAELEESLASAQKVSTLKQIEDLKLRRDYDSAVAILEQIPAEVLNIYAQSSHCIAWWNDREEIPDGENFKAQKFTAEYLLNEQGCNIDLCGYPHEEEKILDPLDTIREYQERRTTLNAEIDKVLAELEALLPGGVIE